MFGKTGIRGQEYGKKNYAGSIVSRSEIYRCNGGRLTGAFQTEEGCLSLVGVRPCTRYKEIEVDYLDTNFKKQHGKYIGWTAQIIQHEVDHCNGIVI